MNTKSSNPVVSFIGYNLVVLPVGLVLSVYVSGFDGLSVKTGENEAVRVDCDAVFVSIGREPSTAFLGGALPIDEQGYLIADETTRTPVDGVFAAGDVRQKRLRQVVTAVADGAVAAQGAEEYLHQL